MYSQRLIRILVPKEAQSSSREMKVQEALLYHENAFELKSKASAGITPAYNHLMTRTAAVMVIKRCQFKPIESSSVVGFCVSERCK